MKRSVFISILLISSCFFATACGSGTAGVPAAEHVAQSSKDEIVLPASAQSESLIQTKAVALSEQPDILRVAGRITLADDRMWRVGVLTEGRVEIVYAGLGDYVKKGQVLARMHSHELHEARAQYETSRSELNRLQAAAALAQRNYDRMETLLTLKAASIQQTEQARQDLLNEQIAMHDGQIAVDRDRIHLEDNLGVPADLASDSHDENADLIPILAPGSGYILDKKVTPGTTVQPSTDTFLIGELSQVWMLASVRQENLADLRVGQSATVTLPGVPGDRFEGKITNLGQELDQTTRAMKVRIVLNNPKMKLKPEMLANAEIPVGKNKPTLLVPSDAIQQINGQDVIFVRTAADRFAIRPIRIGETSEGRTPVFEGLKSGEQIVTRGSFVLKSQLLKSSMEGQ